MLWLLLLLLLLPLLFSSSIGAKLRIKDAKDFIEFSNSIDNGTNYKDSTVLLDSDITFPENVEPIGKNLLNNFHFYGTFDGQGHVISNLTISSSLEYVGLFGYSDASAIKNVVLDDTCSVSSSHNKDYAHVGGILGRNYASHGPCEIENIINMAKVSINGNKSNIYYLGGIIGAISSAGSPTYVSNCANYGSVTNYSPARTAYIGGIIAYTDSYYRKLVQNCLNLGTAFQLKPVTRNLYIGGIVGSSYFMHIVNCLSTGRVASIYIPSKDICYGSITGKVDSQTHINYCLWTNAVGTNKTCGTGTPGDTSYTPDCPVDVGSAVEVLTEYSGSNELNKWLFNPSSKNVAFYTNNVKEFSLTQTVILRPDLAGNEKLLFSGWHTDPLFKKPLQSIEITEDISLYGLYGMRVTVIFNGNGGSVPLESKDVVYNGTYGDLPEPNRTGYSFDGWLTDENKCVFSDTTVLTLSNHTLYSRWTINNYAVLFDFDNGTSIKTYFNFNDIIKYPEGIFREGYTFVSWDNNITHMPAYNLTITALWIINNYTLTFDFNNGTSIKVNFNFNETIKYPENITREGYIFESWGSDVVNMPSHDLTITALWIINNYTVLFDFDNGTSIKVNFNFNETIKYPEGIFREGYTFVSWDNNITHMPAYNLTITALWIINNYTLTFNFNNGTITKDILMFNETIHYPENITRKGYIFESWDNDVVNMPAHDLTITALWVRPDRMNNPLIAEITIPICVVVINATVVVLVVFIRKRRRRVEENRPLIINEVRDFD